MNESQRRMADKGIRRTLFESWILRGVREEKKKIRTTGLVSEGVGRMSKLDKLEEDLMA